MKKINSNNLDKEYERYLENLFVKDFERLLQQIYKANHSRATKRGIEEAKRRKNEQNK